MDGIKGRTLIDLGQGWDGDEVIWLMSVSSGERIDSFVFLKREMGVLRRSTAKWIEKLCHTFRHPKSIWNSLHWQLSMIIAIK